MDDLIAFLRTCLDEDERIARAAEGTEMGPWLDVFEAALDQADQPEDVRRAVGRHIARFTPGRMLWDVTVKRRAIDEYEAAAESADLDDANDRVLLASLGGVLRSMALPYWNQKGCRPEWVREGSVSLVTLGTEYLTTDRPLNIDPTLPKHQRTEGEED